MKKPQVGRSGAFFFLSFIYRIDALSRVEIVEVGIMSNVQFQSN